MATYLRLNGTPTTGDDPQRGVWYGTGRCGYWTDDWSKLGKVGPGIPVCPHCKAPGMQTTAADWTHGIAEYTLSHPGYGEFMTSNLERCHAKVGGFKMAWERWQHENAAAAIKLVPPVEDIKAELKKLKAEKCDHKQFYAEVTVNRLEDTGRFNADVKINCSQCGTPFRFIGLPAGVDLNGAAVSVDGCEARLAIAPKGEVLALTDADAVGGFTVRKTKGGA